MKIDELMSHPALTLSPESNCLEAARLMREAGVGSVVVSTDGGPAGIVTDRDIVIRVVAADRSPKDVSIREVMSPAPLFVFAGRDASFVLELMSDQGVRRLPVVDEQMQIVGIITLDDLIQGVATDLSAVAEAISKEL